MKVSNEKPVILQEKKSDYASPAFRQILNKHISPINEKINNGENVDSVLKASKSEKELNQLAEDINKLSENKNISLIFSADKDTGKNIIKFVDQNTKETVKQVPSEEMLQITEQIDKFLKKHSKVFPTGFLLNERV